MPETTLSVNDLLGLPLQGLGGAILRAGVSDDDWSSFQKKLAVALPGMSWTSVEEAVGRKFSEALNVDPLKLFADAWQKGKTLAQAAEQSRSGETVLVPLWDHPFKSVVQSYIEIVWGPDVIRRINADLNLLLTLKGFIVRVEAGEIRAIEAGSCEGSCEIIVLQQSVWKHAIEPVNLPGKIKLGAGIPIH